jgi:hypothetical protein
LIESRLEECHRPLDTWTRTSCALPRRSAGQRKAIKYTPYHTNRFFSRCVKRAIGAIPMRDHDHSQVLDERIDYATKLFDVALTHYTHLECAPECPCREFYRDGCEVDDVPLEVADSDEEIDVDELQESMQPRASTSTAAASGPRGSLVREVVVPYDATASEVQQQLAVHSGGAGVVVTRTS